MKRLPFGCLAALLLIFSTHRSSAQPYDTTEVGGFLHYLFQSVDKSQIPTGYLEEYGLPVLGSETFGED